MVQQARWVAGGILLILMSTLASASDRPGLPPAMPQPPPAETRDYFRCNREFTYQGKTYDCDSLVRQDGEGLRGYVADTPQAVNELDTYQTTRRQARVASYIGSLGIAAILAGVIIGIGERNNPDPNAPHVGNLVAIAGAGVAGLGLVYGISLIRSNEAHLNNAVQLHNDAHPERAIELKFSTGFAF